MFEDRSAVSSPRESSLDFRANVVGPAKDASDSVDSFRVSERNIDLETATPADEPFLYATFASTRLEELAVTGWSEKQKEQFLRMQFEAQRQSYLRDLPEAEYSVIRRGSIAVGRLIVE